MTRRHHREKEYYSPKQGEWIQRALPPHTNFDSCCDCGLVHRFDFELRPITLGKHKGELTLWCRIFRDDKATAAIRRQRVKAKELYEVDGRYIAIFEGPKKRG